MIGARSSYLGGLFEIGGQANPTRDPPVPAELGDDDGAIGAALLVR